MTKLFLDTNVVVDFLCERGNFYQPAASLVVRAYRGEVQLCCSALTFATASYLMNRYKITKDEILYKLIDFSTLCVPTSVGRQVVDDALHSSFADFEDALQYFSAIQEGADYIVTRNAKDFSPSQIPVLAPEEALNLMTS